MLRAPCTELGCAPATRRPATGPPCGAAGRRRATPRAGSSMCASLGAVSPWQPAGVGQEEGEARARACGGSRCTNQRSPHHMFQVACSVCPHASRRLGARAVPLPMLERGRNLHEPSSPAAPAEGLCAPQEAAPMENSMMSAQRTRVGAGCVTPGWW